ncbi:MAG: deoxyribose-phosphate aldolase [Nitrospirae bacterium]|nr:deoxyribose-phosphate aldolase [Nitrospirota bacterium]MCL5977596.1 deoxyribose-phosphate aldolase [Nitrospirota bacterium]
MSKRKKAKAPLSGNEIARFIDQSLLKPQAKEADIIKLCNDAIKYNFYSVCVNPYYVPLCNALLKGHEIKVTAVIGFPLGMTLKDAKIYEAKQAVLYGADELDIVMNIGAAKSGNWDYVAGEILEIISATKSAVHKVIIETCYLTEEEKIAAIKIASLFGAKFIKTSTGFGSKGATIKDVKLMKKILGHRAEIKAAGGIRTLSQALNFIKAGATRIGTSAGVEIMKEAQAI